MSSEANLYLRKAEEKLETARRLLGRGRYEDAVSRDYYAVLNAARGALARENQFPKAHEGILKEFGVRMIKGRGILQDEVAEGSCGLLPHVATSKAHAESCI